MDTHEGRRVYETGFECEITSKQKTEKPNGGGPSMVVF